MSSDAALLAEIAKLKGAIDQHKTQPNPPPTRGYPVRGRYANRGSYRGSYRPPYAAPRPPAAEQREVEIGGVTYVTDGKTMTRKDVIDRPQPKLASRASSSGPSSAIGSDFVSIDSDGNEVKRPSAPAQAELAGKRTRLNNLTLILNNAQAQRYRRRQPSGARSAKEKKQCPFFTRTGICTRGRTCRYQHNPDKVAMCQKFLKGDCPNGENCPLSHEPSPQRMPFCVHFANAGRCKNGDSCIYPHVHLGANAGVCRDFAVLGYCEKGADCDKKHVRECPDFAATGVCKNRRCKLPHVIRAKHAAKAKEAGTSAPIVSAGQPVPTGSKRKHDLDDNEAFAHDAKKQKVDDDSTSFADEPEFIPLTFEESEEEDPAADGEGEQSADDDAEDGEGEFEDSEDEPEFVITA